MYILKIIPIFVARKIKIVDQNYILFIGRCKIHIYQRFLKQIRLHLVRNAL